MSTTSGFSRSAAATASRPSAASPATSMPTWSSRKRRRPSRTTAWSSTTSTRIGSATRHLQPHRRAGAGRGADHERAAEALCALLHRREAEPPRAQLRRGRLEAHAVVLHLEHDTAVEGRHAHGDPARVGVAYGVLDRLLRDPQHLAVAARLARRRLAEVQVDLAL